MPLSGIRSDALDSIEAQIYADAASTRPTAPDGELRAIPKQSMGGHQITEFVGSPSAWMSALAGPVRQYVKSFLTREA